MVLTDKAHEAPRVNKATARHSNKEKAAGGYYKIPK